MSYTYGLILRPAMIGTVPDNYTFTPGDDEPYGYFRWGTVTYAEPLTDEQVDKYELVCDSFEHIERITQETQYAFAESVDNFDLSSFTQESLRELVADFLPRGKWSKKVHPKHNASIIDKVLENFHTTNRSQAMANIEISITSESRYDGYTTISSKAVCNSFSLCGDSESEKQLDEVFALMKRDLLHKMNKERSNGDVQLVDKFEY